MTALVLEEVTVKYQHRTVIDKLNWQVETGKIYSVIGPNGCGKSTLLKTIAGHLKPDRGEVLLDGKPIGSYSRRHLAKCVAMLQQSQDKLPEMTCARSSVTGAFHINRCGEPTERKMRRS